MKTLISKTLLVASLLLFTFSTAYAYRPVWLLGHRCNSEEMIRLALDDGANGVEIDVQCGSTGGSHWCVSHGVFVSEDKCDPSNWMALKVLLKKSLLLTDKRFALLYIDVKDTKYIKELVQYVHKSCPNPPFDIVYGLNLDKMSSIPDGDIKWMADSLREREGFCTQNDGDIKGIESKLQRLNFPITKYCYVDGNCVSTFATWSYLRKAAQKKFSHQLCCRTGFWTCQYATHANGAYQDDVFCDLTIVESRGWGATSAFRWATYYTYHDYIANPGKYGLQLANRETNRFWKSYKSGE